MISIDSVPVTSRSDVQHRGHISGVCVFNCVGLGRLVVPTCPFCASDFFDLPDLVFLGLSLLPDLLSFWPIGFWDDGVCGLSCCAILPFNFVNSS